MQKNKNCFMARYRRIIVLPASVAKSSLSVEAIVVLGRACKVYETVASVFIKKIKINVIAERGLFRIGRKIVYETRVYTALVQAYIKVCIIGWE